MMKKYFLKGKEFLKKKLEQLEIEQQNTDYVAQQIPKRLLQKLRIFESSDYDLEATMQYSSYFRTYPNHPISPLLYQRYKQQKPIQYQLKAKIKQNQSLIPEFDIQLEKKAFALKYTVDSYDQGLPQLESPLICICVVHFHHKRGTQIQFRYPFNQNVEKIEERIVHCAMPDSSHNKAQDYNFFNFQAIIDKQKKMLFGVSYFKQIKLTEAMKAKNEQLTRSHVQKAVCVISLLPIFGYLKMRLALTTKLFFQNFTNFQSVKHAYLDMSKHLNDTSQKMDYSQLYIGTDLRRILKHFGAKLFQIYKAILYQKRIVIFSHSPSSCSSFILSLLSLFPGLLSFGMHSRPINRYLQGLRQYALPLKLFNNQNPLILSFHIQDLYLLNKYKNNTKGGNVEGHYLIGTTNRLVKQSKNNIGIQMLVNLEDCSVEWFQTNNINQQIWEGVTKQEKTFIEDILKVLQMDFTCGYQGSQDWIRDLFHNYLKQRLVKIVQAKKKYLQFINQCKKYSKLTHKNNKTRKNSLKTGNKLYSVMEDQVDQSQPTPLPRRDQQQIDFPEVDQCVLSIPLVPLLLKPHFTYFLQFHNPNLHLLTQKYTCDESLIIENWQYYLGSLPLRQKWHIIYNIKTRKLKFTDKRKSNIVKQIKFDDDGDEITQIFVGHQVENKYNGQGFLINQHQYYEGEFHNNSRHGFGKLVSSVQTYIGYFQNGLYNGQGQLINHLLNIVYVGNFKDGLKEGQGKLQKGKQYTYQGEFLENQMWGNGQIIYQQQEDISQQKQKLKPQRKQAKIFANFVKGNIDQSKQITIKYRNGDAYAGYAKNLVPHGRGTYRQNNGDLQSGLFKNGSLVKEDEIQN